jgi:hypothetical protein
MVFSVSFNLQCSAKVSWRVVFSFLRLLEIRELWERRDALPVAADTFCGIDTVTYRLYRYRYVLTNLISPICRFVGSKNAVIVADLFYKLSITMFI